MLIRINLNPRVIVTSVRSLASVNSIPVLASQHSPTIQRSAMRAKEGEVPLSTDPPPTSIGSYHQHT